MRIWRVVMALAISAVAFGSLTASLHADESGAVPPFTDVFNLVRSNLVGATSEELNRAAVLGLVAQLQPKVSLVSSQASETNTAPLVTRTRMIEPGYAWLQIGRVESGLAQAVRTAYEPLHASNSLNGLVVDLRYAGGVDYGTAAETADLFFKTEQALLQWGSHSARSSAKAGAIDLPMVVLINSRTIGAAEALAAALRQAESAVLIGSPTAGQAYLYDEFRLADGETLRIAHGRVSVGSGEALTERGVLPDIQVKVSPEEEKAFFEDPYRNPASRLARSDQVDPTGIGSAVMTTNRARRLNEAELVRRQREGESPDADVGSSPGASTLVTAPVVRDPVLARGLDILKGLALALKRR